MTTTRFNFNATNNNEINQSLIQIVGLLPGDNYFLYPVKTQEESGDNPNMTDFSVFAKLSVGPNGAVIINNSLGKVRTQDFSFNSTIPDFQSGINEYNVLPVDGSQVTQINVKKQIILPITLVVFVMVVIAVVLIRFV
ncbi:hypothetical protein [Lactococcus protaetiae]|uniref:Uncharacterized protein n=1 Tax=Lactococcus protaetiae TaxID=2592653 RepID=A0A514Z7C9_9LACT|nr:hypothetical protein [Lactococcus protaetiae]QDK70484.1 hypothetical protein FLP15_03970 [Lactococcus protaetiae]